MSPAIRACDDARMASSSRGPGRRGRRWCWSRSYARRLRAGVAVGDVAVRGGGGVEVVAAHRDLRQLDGGAGEAGEVGRRGSDRCRRGATGPRREPQGSRPLPCRLDAERQAREREQRTGAERGRDGYGGGGELASAGRGGGRRCGARSTESAAIGRRWEVARWALACSRHVRQGLHHRGQRHRRRPTEPPRQAERPGSGHVPGDRRRRGGPEGRSCGAGGGALGGGPGVLRGPRLRQLPGHGGERAAPAPERPAEGGGLGAIGDTGGRITHLGQQSAWVWQELDVPVIAAVHGPRSVAGSRSRSAPTSASSRPTPSCPCSRRAGGSSPT